MKKNKTTPKLFRCSHCNEKLGSRQIHRHMGAHEPPMRFCSYECAEATRQPNHKPQVITVSDSYAPKEPAPMSSDEGRKNDDDKLRLDLLPFAAVNHVALVLTYGAEKYAPYNWRKVEGWRWRYFAAALRHLTAWWLGEKNDPESGLPHLAHAACCVLFLLELDT